MKNITLISIVTLLFFSLGISESIAQQRKNVYKQEVMQARGDNPELIDKDICDMPDVEHEDLSTSRGAWCKVNFNNHTGYYVNIWIDGYYKGTIAPHGDGYVDLASGWTKFYCETTGGDWFWEDSGSCDGYENFDLR